MSQDKPNEKFTPSGHPGFGDRVLSEGQATIEYGKKFLRDADEAIDLPPSAAAMWLAALVGYATWRASKSLLSNFGARSGIGSVVRPVVGLLLAYGAASYSHDHYLESQNIRVQGRAARGDEIHITKPKANEHTSRAPKRRYDYAPVYGPDHAPSTDSAPVRERTSRSYRGEADSGLQQSFSRGSTGEESPRAENVDLRRHNRGIVAPQ